MFMYTYTHLCINTYTHIISSIVEVNAQCRVGISFENTVKKHKILHMFFVNLKYSNNIIFNTFAWVVEPRHALRQSGGRPAWVDHLCAKACERSSLIGSAASRASTRGAPWPRATMAWLVAALWRPIGRAFGRKAGDARRAATMFTNVHPVHVSILFP